MLDTPRNDVRDKGLYDHAIHGSRLSSNIEVGAYRSGTKMKKVNILESTLDIYCDCRERSLDSFL